MQGKYTKEPYFTALKRHPGLPLAGLWALAMALTIFGSGESLSITKGSLIVWAMSTMLPIIPILLTNKRRVSIR